MQVMELMHSEIPEVSDLTVADKIIIAYFFVSFAPLAYVPANYFASKATMLKDYGPEFWDSLAFYISLGVYLICMLYLLYKYK